MRPGERIRMIIEAADSLTPLSWGKAWLICSEFGFEVYDPDHEEKLDSDWWIRVLQRSDKGDLEGLNIYLSGDEQAPQPAGRWATVPLFVFLSHLYAHRDFATRLRDLLSRYGIGSFVAHVDIEPSKAWRDEIKAALASCHAFVALVQHSFHESEWCDQEVGWALGRHIPIIPVRFAGVQRRDGFLADFQDVNMGFEEFGGEERISRQIFRILFDDPRTHDDGTLFKTPGD